MNDQDPPCAALVRATLERTLSDGAITQKQYRYPPERLAQCVQLSLRKWFHGLPRGAVVPLAEICAVGEQSSSLARRIEIGSLYQRSCGLTDVRPLAHSDGCDDV